MHTLSHTSSLLTYLASMCKGLLELSLWQTLSEVDDGVVQITSAVWVITPPRGGVIIHMKCLSR